MQDFAVENIQGITLDLDDTLWPVIPVIQKAEALIIEWFRRRFPSCAQQFQAAVFQSYRERISRSHARLAHDLTEQRRLAFDAMLSDFQLPAGAAQEAMEVFLEARQQVELFPDVEPALSTLSRQFPIVAITNGNADLNLIGLDHYVPITIAARQVGAKKPDVRIFEAARDRLRLPPEKILHIGDHLEDDIAGARACGMRTAWINRFDGSDPEPGAAADWAVKDLVEIVDLLLG